MSLTFCAIAWKRPLVRFVQGLWSAYGVLLAALRVMSKNSVSGRSVAWQARRQLTEWDVASRCRLESVQKGRRHRRMSIGGGGITGPGLVSGNTGEERRVNDHVVRDDGRSGDLLPAWARDAVEDHLLRGRGGRRGGLLRAVGGDDGRLRDADGVDGVAALGRLVLVLAWVEPEALESLRCLLQLVPERGGAVVGLIERSGLGHSVL